MARRPQPPQERAWKVYKISGSRMQYQGTVYAENEKKALDRALEELTIPASLRERLVVRPND